MRLIDADKIPYVQDVTYMKDYDYAYRYAIEAEPTVDAIPIDYIENIIGMLEMDYEFGNEETREPSYYGINVLQSVINGWRKHNETD